MTLKKIIEKCSRLGVYDKRFITDEYVELVFYNREIDEWNRVFIDILGPAIKPPGAEPTEDERRLTRHYGGVWSSQTLFKKDFGDATIISMFWPWQDNVHTTLKAILFKKR
jgi:hypothetical protein